MALHMSQSSPAQVYIGHFISKPWSNMYQELNFVPVYFNLGVPSYLPLENISAYTQWTDVVAEMKHIDNFVHVHPVKG